jgi:hypothetical protein
MGPTLSADGLPESDDDPLIPFPIPALVDILTIKEREKGEPLTEMEVNEIRDNAVCMMLPKSAAEKMTAARGYSDIDPEFAWEQWRH